MVITMQDRETLTAIVTEAVAAALGKKTAPVEETRIAPAEKARITVQGLLDKVREYRAVLKKHDRVMDQFRDHPADSKNANRAIENARNDLEEAEEGFVEFCKAVAAGTTVIERGT